MIEELITYICFGILIVFAGIIVLAMAAKILELCLSSPEFSIIMIGVILGIVLYLNKYYWHIP